MTAQVASTGDGIVIFDSNDIKSASIINLSDLFSLNQRWNISTIDGFSYRAAANNLSVYQKQNFIVLVDGQKMNLNVFDLQNVDLLPFTINQVDSIIFVDLPILYRGEFSRQGLIHIKLKKPVDGLSLNAIQSVGNEIGDPGPYAFTRHKTANIDKLGYLLGAAFGSTGNSWTLAGNFKFRENFITDQATDKRIGQLTGDQKARLLGVSINSSFNYLNGTHNLFFSYTEHDEYFYFRPYGNEIPITRVFKHVGLDGNFYINQNIFVNYLLQGSTNDLIDKPNEKDFNFDLVTNSFLSRIEGTYRHPWFTSLIGLSFERIDGKRSKRFNDERINFLKFYTSMTVPFNESFELRFGGVALKNENANAYKGYVSNLWTMAKKHFIQLNTSYSENLFNEDLNFWVWTQNEQKILYPDLINVSDIDRIEKSKTFTLDFSYKYQPNQIFFINLFGNFRHFENYYLEIPKYTLDKSSESLTVSFDLAQNENLKVVSGGSEIFHMPLNNFSYKISYNYNTVYNGTYNFKNIRKEIPQHKVSLICYITPVDDLSFWTELRYTSSTRWSEYNFISRQSDGKYNNVIDGQVIFDLSVQKWFWNKKFWISLLFKNLFNQREIYHPVGVNLDLRFFLQLHLYLNSILN